MNDSETYQPLYDRPVDQFIDIPQSEVEEIKKNHLADDVIIDENNFHEYFFDVRMHQPRSGQVMARFRSRAELVDGQLKRDMVNLLIKHERGGEAAKQVMKKLACAIETDAIKVPLEMASDLARGMSADEVCEKPYEYGLECFYYTDAANVPKNDKHWEIIKLIGKPNDDRMTITSNIKEKLKELGLNNDSENSLEEDYGSYRRTGDVGEEVGRSPGEMGSGGPPSTAESPEG